jgi:hypothetical protein
MSKRTWLSKKQKKQWLQALFDEEVHIIQEIQKIDD